MSSRYSTKILINEATIFVGGDNENDAYDEDDDDDNLDLLR